MFEIWFAVLKLVETMVRIYRMVYPTNQSADSRGRKTRKKSSPAIAKAPRAKPAPPEIYVRTSLRTFTYGHARTYALAHLRNKGGYLYLSWRDGGKIRTHYLGKAPKASPTDIPRSEPGLPAAAAPRRAGRRDRA
jgi:hypothetical protein